MMKSVPDTAASQILSDGFALLEADEKLINAVMQIFSQSGDFFQQDVASKMQSSTPELLEGYMALGTEYSQTVERPDLCEAFAVWIRNKADHDVASWADKLPLHKQISEALPLYANTANAVFQALREQLNPEGVRVEASEVSYLQLNYYRPADFTRDLLQDPHEDGHLLTIVRPTAPGVEIRLGDRYEKIPLKDNEMLLMPGSLLTLLTGGLVPPLYHRVNNDRSTRIRQSLMFFINPSLDHELEPWIKNETNAGKSIRETSIRNSASFGLRSIEDAKPEQKPKAA